MGILIACIVIYLILGICYAIDFFHNEYNEMVLNQGMKAGQFFFITIIVAFLWPFFIIIYAYMDIKNER